MKILFVINEFYAKNNGLSNSAQRYAAELKARGHQVRILAGNWDGEPDYALREYKIPFFNGLIKRQGMTFAKTDDQVIEKAVAWADVVHLADPFVLSAHAAQAASRQGKACTGGFHVYPENITSSIHLAKCEPLNNLLMDKFNRYVFRYCSDIHCPTKYVEERLHRHGYAARMHVISNGVPPEFTARPCAKPAEYEGKFVILCVGRYSLEKRQDILIDAVRQSDFAGKVQLIFAGQGPLKERYQSMVKDLPNPPVFRFMDKDALIEAMSYSDLYVHTADAEVEGMSALEAISCGLVPVISDSAKSSTKQIALDMRSIFIAGSPESLKGRIAYWMEQDAERRRMGRRYAELAKKYSVSGSVTALEAMFTAACESAYGCEQEEAL